MNAGESEPGRSCQCQVEDSQETSIGSCHLILRGVRKRRDDMVATAYISGTMKKYKSRRWPRTTHKCSVRLTVIIFVIRATTFLNHLDT